MIKLYGARTVEAIQRNLESAGVSSRSAAAAARRLARLDSELYGGLVEFNDAKVPVAKAATKTIKANRLFAAALFPIGFPFDLEDFLSELQFIQLHSTLYPRQTLDQYLRFARELERRGSASPAGPAELTVFQRRAGACVS